MINFQLGKSQLKGCWSLFVSCLLKGRSYSISTRKLRYNQYISAHSTNPINKKALQEEMINVESHISASEPKQVTKQLYAQAQQWYKNQKVSEAIDNLIKSIQIDNNSQQAYFLLGNIMLQQNKYKQAIQSYQQVIRINPNHSDAYNNVGIALKELGQISEALRAFQISFSINDQDYRVNNNLGVIYLVCLQNIEQAAKYLRNAAYFNPYGFQEYLELGQQLSDQHRYSESIIFLINAFFRNMEHQITIKLLKNSFLLGDKVREAREFYKWLIDNGMSNYSVYYSLGSLLFQLGQIQQSKQYLKKAIQLNDRSYETNLYLATVYAKQSNTEEAIKHYENCIKAKPDNSVAYSSLGIIYLHLYDISRAASVFTKATQIDSRDSVALSGLGSILLMKGQVEQGIKYLKQAIQIDPKNYPALQKIGNTLYLLGREQQGNHYLALARKVINENNDMNSTK